MAPQINFVAMKKETYSSEWFARSAELLKAHGVIKRYKDIIDGTKFQYTNVVAFKTGTGTAPKGFIDYFIKQYGDDLKRIEKLPVPITTKQVGALKIGLNGESRLATENRLLREQIEMLKRTIEDKSEIISLLRERK